MDWPVARARFHFLAEALGGLGGFAPRVRWEDETISTTAQDGTTQTATRRVPKTAAPCYLVQYPRESAEKYAGRCAVAVYENHLHDACSRFASYLARRRPLRDGTDSPLVDLLLQDADLRGTGLNEFMVSLALQVKARGTMFVLMDRPEAMDEGAASLLEQTQRRAVPYLRAIAPEAVEALSVDPLTGSLLSVTVAVFEEIDGRAQAAQRTWDTKTWRLHVGDRTVRQGEHGFGQCPVLAITESGEAPPVIGAFAQVADLSLRIYNARSERDEILRSQTFSVLTLQTPPGSSRPPAEVAASIGTHSLLVHEGITPAFVSPDSGPATVYREVLEELSAAIRRKTLEDATGSGLATESGLAKRMRFEALNAALTSMALQMQALERRIWALFHRSLGTVNRVSVEYPTDFNLVDTLAELDILAAMQASGFPDEVLRMKMKTVVASEFDAAEEDDKAAALAAIDEAAQAASNADPSNPDNTINPEDTAP